MALRTPLSVTPHLYMGDSTGRPLDKGVVYFGEQDKDPEFYPINLFSDDALTKPLAQPVHTKGGYLYDKGDMVEPHAKELIYSVKVLDSYGRKVFYKGAMMRNSWNDDVIEQINTAIIGSADAARQVAIDITNDAINNTAIEGGVLADTFVVVDGSLSQRTINKGLESIADLSTIKNPKTGLRIYVKSYYAGGTRGGGWFEYDATKASINDMGLVINGWVREASKEVSVYDFGALGDGINDETEVLQSALNACAGKHALVFSGGQFLVNAAPNKMPFPYYGGLVIPSNTSMKGANNVTIVCTPNSYSKYMIATIYGAENVHIDGINFRGDRDAHTYPTVFRNKKAMDDNKYMTKDNYRTDDSWLEDDKAYIIYSTSSENGVYRYRDGQWVKTTETYKPTDYLSHEHGIGLSIQNSKNIIVENCSFTMCTGDGLLIAETNQGPKSNADGYVTRQVVVRNNTINYCRRQGLSVVAGSDIYILNNTIKNIGYRVNMQDGTAPRSGVDVESGGSVKSFNVVISGNIITKCQGISLHNYDGIAVTVTGNILDNGFSSIYGSQSSVTGNVISGSFTGSFGFSSSILPYTLQYLDGELAARVVFDTPPKLNKENSHYFEFLDDDGNVIKGGIFVCRYVSDTVYLLEHVQDEVSERKKIAESGFVRFKPSTTSNVISGNLFQDFSMSLSGTANITNNLFVNGGIHIENGECIIFDSNTVKARSDLALKILTSKTVSVRNNSFSDFTKTAVRIDRTEADIVNNKFTVTLPKYKAQTVDTYDFTVLYINTPGSIIKGNTFTGGIPLEELDSAINITGVYIFCSTPSVSNSPLTISDNTFKSLGFKTLGIMRVGLRTYFTNNNIYMHGTGNVFTLAGNINGSVIENNTITCEALKRNDGSVVGLDELKSLHKDYRLLTNEPYSGSLVFKNNSLYTVNDNARALGFYISGTEKVWFIDNLMLSDIPSRDGYVNHNNLTLNSL